VSSFCWFLWNLFVTECATIPPRRSRVPVSRHESEEPAQRITAGRIGPDAAEDRPTAAPFAGCFRAQLWLFFYAPLLMLAMLTLIFRFSDADLAICRWCYGEACHPWWTSSSSVWRFLYAYGPLPALTLGIGGLGVAILGLFWQRLRPYCPAGFFLAAMLALGPGLIINGVFKPHWQRPRPLQTRAFGGSQPFVPVWDLGADPQGKSFPCGHASMGFYLLAPAFLCYQQRRWALAFVALGLAGGLLIGAGRIAQGAHYPSDVVWSGGMVYLSGLVLWGVFQLGKWTQKQVVDAPRPIPEPILLRFPGPSQDWARESADDDSSRRAA
jgi:lipid A 4'-phosphatase